MENHKEKNCIHSVCVAFTVSFSDLKNKIKNSLAEHFKMYQPIWMIKKYFYQFEVECAL